LCGALATPLLRFKALMGDEQPLVIAECLSGLMQVAPDESFDFVAALIDPERPEVAQHAAMALAESRLPGAYDLLKERYEASLVGELRAGLVLPIALTRHDEVPDLLLSILGSGDLAQATAAIAALAISGACRVFASGRKPRSRGRIGRGCWGSWSARSRRTQRHVHNGHRTRGTDPPDAGLPLLAR
jgi:hypothetical protein